VVGAEVLEEAPASAKEDRDQVDLDLVEGPGSEGELGDAGAVDEDVLVAGGLLRLRHRGLDVGQVGDQGQRGSTPDCWRLRMKIGTPS
jgi:hypothetical protein